MHAFGGKIYFGTGNSANSGPAVNAGPADLYTFTPATEEFTKEYTVDEEQIHLIREFDGELYLPGHDSRESWNLGNYYRLESNGWKKYRTLPQGVHVYDIHKFGDRLFAAGSFRGSNMSTMRVNIQVSHDDGQTWDNVVPLGTPYPTSYTINRCYTIVPFAGGLYSDTGYLVCEGPESDFVESPETLRFFNLGFNPASGILHIERAVVFGGATFYIAGLSYNDHQYKPLFLARARSLDDKSRLELPEGALPRDLLVKGEWLLALISTPLPTEEGEGFVNAVLATKDAGAEPADWMELFRFTAPAFARSFEYMDGVFYFGLGCDFETYTSPSQLSQATGDILSIPFDNLTE